MTSLAFARRYSMAHRFLSDAAPKCMTPHGHDEIVTVRVCALAPVQFGGANMAAPFDAVKGRWKAWIDDHVDHAFQLNDADPLLAWFRSHEPARLAHVMTFAGDPTTEALAAAFWLKLAAFLHDDNLPFAVEEIRIDETPTNAVILNAAPASAPAPWCTRADMSINDL
jgi:6-pyruvoyltetrahydropterin/6-carboxytetrahydropterin synthase